MQTQISHNTHLTRQEKQNPASVFESFFDYYDLEKAQNEIQNLVQIGLVTDNDLYDTGAKRDNLLNLQQQLLKLIEAASLMAENS